MPQRGLLIAPIAVFGAAISACAGSPLSTPQEGFWANVSALCGNAYRGELVSTDEQDADFRSAEIVMHVAECGDQEIRIPLHVGDDRSRTWVLTRADNTISLHHDHRHEDGEPDDITLYGGTGVTASADTRVEFPADDATKALFDRTGIPVSKSNTWAMEAHAETELFAYEMSRPNRFFRIEFDTSTPQSDLPPKPWGHDE